VVDLALLPADRNAGIGMFLMRQVCAEAAQAGKPVRLSVLKNSRAVRWYERLGFAKTEEGNVRQLAGVEPPSSGCAHRITGSSSMSTRTPSKFFASATARRLTGNGL